MQMSFSLISKTNPYHNSILQIGEIGDDTTYEFGHRRQKTCSMGVTLAQFCIWSPLPPAPPAFTDTLFKHCILGFLHIHRTCSVFITRKSPVARTKPSKVNRKSGYMIPILTRRTHFLGGSSELFPD